MGPPGQLRRLTGKVALVTGGGSTSGGIGVGQAIARTFAREGAAVCVVDSDEARAESTVACIAEEGGRALALVADVACEADCAASLRDAAAQFGGVDILVNNAGIAPRVIGTAFDEGEWGRVIDVNLKGAVHMAREAARGMKARGGGAIVNIASVAALTSSGGGMFVYGPSKAAMMALTRDLAVCYGRDRIRANTIVAGYLDTPMATSHRGPADADSGLRARITPLGFVGDAWDVASASLFLAGDEARFVTGACLAVDGGVLAMSPLRAAELAGA